MAGLILGCDTEWRVVPDGAVPPLVVLSIDGELIKAQQVDRLFLRELLSETTVWAAAHTDLFVLAHHANAWDEVFEALAGDRILDILIRQRLLDIAVGKLNYVHAPKPKKGKRPPPYSVSTVAWRHGFAKDEDGDEWRMRYGELLDVPLELWPEAASRYAAHDSVVNKQILQAQDTSPLVAAGVFVNQHAQTRMAWALHLAAQRGVKVDSAAVDTFAASVEAQRVAFQATLRESGILRPDGTRDTKLAQERAFRAGVTARTPGGDVSLTRESLSACDNPVLHAYVEETHLGKLMGTYVAAMRKGPRMHGSYVSPLDTGRTSMRAPTLQVLPRAVGVRECLVADPGRCLISVDVDKAELVSLAQIILELFGESTLADALRNGVDPHCMVGAQITGMGLEDFNRAYLGGDNTCSEARQDGKPCNFGFSGGMGPAKFVSYYAGSGAGKTITLEKAYALRNSWRRTWPDIVEYLAWIGRLSERSTSVKQFKSGRLRGGLSYCDMANGFFQGLTADAMSEVLWELAKAQRWDSDSTWRKPLFGSSTLVFVHDEVIIDAPIERCDEVARAVQDLVQTVYRRWTPDLPVSAGATAMLRWSKKAKRKMNTHGALIPWDLEQAA